MPTSWFQSFNAVFVILLAPIFARLWLSLGAKKHRAVLAGETGCGTVASLSGISPYCLWRAGCGAGCEGEYSLAYRVIFHSHNGRALPLSHWSFHGKQAVPSTFCITFDGGVWYLSMATANKLAGALSSLYPEEGKVKSLLGIEISTLFDFFYGVCSDGRSCFFYPAPFVQAIK